MDAAGKTSSQEATYWWIYAHPQNELAKPDIVLGSEQTSRRRRKPSGDPISSTAARVLRQG